MFTKFNTDFCLFYHIGCLARQTRLGVLGRLDQCCLQVALLPGSISVACKRVHAESQPHPRPTASESLGVVPSTLCFIRLSRKGELFGPALLENAARGVHSVQFTWQQLSRIPVEREPFSPPPSFPQTDLIIRHPLRDDGTTMGRAVLDLEVDRGPASEFLKYLKVENPFTSI